MISPATGHTMAMPKVEENCRLMGRKADVRTGTIGGRWSWQRRPISGYSRAYSIQLKAENIALKLQLLALHREMN